MMMTTTTMTTTCLMWSVDGFVGLDEDVARAKAKWQDVLSLGGLDEVEAVAHQVDVGWLECH